jgi:anaerobic magnesium-protoporphyrin IX monomethyl ester cyclase
MKRLRVLLVNLGRDHVKLTSPPVGIMSLAAHVRSRLPVDFELLDQRLEDMSYEEVAQHAIRSNADAVGFSYLTAASGAIGRITGMVREAAPEKFLMLGGPHPSAVEEQALVGTSADIAVVGEGELSMEQICARLLAGSGMEDVPGLVRRGEDGEVVRNPGCTPEVEDLDTLPFLAYDLLPVERYWTRIHHSLVPPPRKYLVLFTSRGCPYRCTYCHHVFGKSFRGQSAERIVSEMEHLQRTYGVEEIDVLEDIFNLDRARVVDFGQEVTKRNLKLKFTIASGVRTDLITEETAEALIAGGLRMCAFALESGSPRIQKVMKKNLNIPKFLRGVELIARRGVFSYGFNMFGFPTETASDMQMTIDTASNSWLHAAVFFKATPYPNTEFYNAAMEMVPERMALLDYDSHDFISQPVINLSDEPDEVLLQYTRKAVRSFYGRPGRLYRLMRDYPKRARLFGYIPGAISHAVGKRVSYKHPQRQLEIATHGDIG